jgi:hypothetical protein
MPDWRRTGATHASAGSQEPAPIPASEATLERLAAFPTATVALTDEQKARLMAQEPSRAECTCGGDDSDGRMDVLNCAVHGQLPPEPASAGRDERTWTLRGNYGEGRINVSGSPVRQGWDVEVVPRSELARVQEQLDQAREAHRTLIDRIAGPVGRLRLIGRTGGNLGSGDDVNEVYLAIRDARAALASAVTEKGDGDV